MADSTLATEEIRSPHYTEGSDRPILWVVIHDEEAPETPRTAHNVGQMFANPGGPHVSAHYTVDMRTIAQCVAEKDVAWAAGHTGNAYGIHLELSGFAKQSAAEWLADGGMLDLAARLVADVCARNGLPTVFVDAAGLKIQSPGITTHNQITLAFPGETTHTDPGPNFPMDAFLQRVAEALAQAPALAEKDAAQG
jgi:N-acetyl-anhydromuramyl-L-alanine amidase AmpD